MLIIYDVAFEIGLVYVVKHAWSVVECRCWGVFWRVEVEHFGDKLHVAELCDLSGVEEVLECFARLRIVWNWELHRSEDFFGHGAVEDGHLIFATDEVGMVLKCVDKRLDSKADVADLTCLDVEAFDVKDESREVL